MNAVEIAAGNGQVAGRLGSARKRNRVVLFNQALARHRHADVGVVVECDALGFHLLDPPVKMALLKLEVGNPVAEKAAGFAILFIDMDVVTRTRELLGASETRGTGTDHRNLLIRLAGRGLWLDPPFSEGTIDNRAFNGLDRDRGVLDVQGAGRFAGRRANASGNFREVVGRKKIACGFGPVAAIGEVVPVGDLVVHRTADVTIGNAAIHATRRLIARRLLAQRQNELAIMADSVGGRRITPVRPINLQKPCDLTHLAAPKPGRRLTSRTELPVRFNKALVSSCKDFAARPAAAATTNNRSRLALGRLTRPRPSSAVRFGPRVQPARADTRPASLCGISASKHPSPPGGPAPGWSRCSAHG